jgi:hypothetical protein
MIGQTAHNGEVKEPIAGPVVSHPECAFRETRTPMAAGADMPCPARDKA